MGAGLDTETAAVHPGIGDQRGAAAPGPLSRHRRRGITIRVTTAASVATTTSGMKITDRIAMTTTAAIAPMTTATTDPTTIVALSRRRATKARTAKILPNPFQIFSYIPPKKEPVP